MIRHQGVRRALPNSTNHSTHVPVSNTHLCDLRRQRLLDQGNESPLVTVIRREPNNLPDHRESG